MDTAITLSSFCLHESGRLNLRFFWVSAEGGAGGLSVLERKGCIKKKIGKKFGILTSEGLFVSRILRAFEEEINELRPFFTSAFRAFLSGAEYFLASSISLQLRCKVKIFIIFVLLDIYFSHLLWINNGFPNIWIFFFIYL